MNLYNLRLAIIVIAFVPSIAAACICMPLGDNFFDTVTQHNRKIANGEFPKTDALTVVTGKVIRYSDAPADTIPDAMLVKVNQVIQGNVATRKIWVHGDVDGMQCRPPVINFPVDTKYIFAVNRDEHNQLYISGCGYYFSRTN